MREYTKKTENQSRTLDSNPRASRQAPISEILQTYKNGTLGRQSIQRERVEDKELLQTKKSEQAPASVILQRYKESIQRNEPEEDEELLQGKFDTLQREEIDEDKLLQGKFESDIQTEQEPIQRKEKPNNTGLPNNLKVGIGNLSGYSLDDVKVHYNSDKPAQLNALAYTQGTDIHIASGQEKHLPHEVWHVVQQKQGRVQPTMQLQGVNINDNEGLEREADVMGIKVMQEKSINQTTYSFTLNAIQGEGEIDTKTIKTVQFVRTAAGNQYIKNILTLGEWGGYVEANAIATTLQFTSRIYRLDTSTNSLIEMATIGNGPDAGRSLYWSGNHYQVLNGGAELNGQQVPNIEYNPIGDGNCMYEAIYYIHREGAPRVIEGLLEPTLREAWVMRMRRIASENIDDALANILGEELVGDEDVQKDGILNIVDEKKKVEYSSHVSRAYQKYPPADFYVKIDKKKPSFYKRSDNKKEIDINTYLLKQLKITEKKDRDYILHFFSIDRSYFILKPKTIEEDITPFISLEKDVQDKLYIMKVTKTDKIRIAAAESGFETYSGGKSVEDAVDAAINGLDLSGSISFKHSRHDFQDSRDAYINLQIQLGGSRPYRKGKGDTSSTLVVIDAILFKNSKRFKSIVQAAHRLSFNEHAKVELLPFKK